MAKNKMGPLGTMNLLGGVADMKSRGTLNKTSANPDEDMEGGGYSNATQGDVSPIKKQAAAIAIKKKNQMPSPKKMV